MAEPLDLRGILGLDPARPDLCTVEATVVTGFEPTVAEEVQAVLGLPCCNLTRGRVVFDIPCSRVAEVLSLRCISTAYLLLGHAGPGHRYEGAGPEEQVEAIAQWTGTVDWEKGLRVWAGVMGFKGRTQPLRDPVIAGEEQQLAFRATCYRTGEKQQHQFPSPLVASTVGGHLQDLFGWQASMKKYDLEFVVNCDPDQLYCAITLNHSSLGNRTITEFGLCTLRPNTAACLARLAQLQPGEVVLDPMAGTGAIPLEGALGFPATFHLAGELAGKSVRSCRANLDGVVAKNKLASGPAMDTLQWDCITAACLRDNSVDVIISDLPFGRRSGSKADNKKLYPDMLVSMARLVRPGSGRAVLLTQDKTSMFASLRRVSHYWSRPAAGPAIITTNIGGLTAIVFLLARTGQAVV